MKYITEYGPAAYKPNTFPCQTLNGRQLSSIAYLLSKEFRRREVSKIKNVVAAAYASATQIKGTISTSHLPEAVTANEEFEDNFYGAALIANLCSYT